MGRMPVPLRPKSFNHKGCPFWLAWGITRRFHRLSPGKGLVAYALRTRAPLSEVPKDPFPFDLHVLGLPLAFILSQDQTLHCIIVVLSNFPVLGFRCCFKFTLLASYAGFRLSKNFRPQLHLPSLRAKTAAKLQLFWIRATKI